MTITHRTQRPEAGPVRHRGIVDTKHTNGAFVRRTDSKNRRCAIYAPYDDSQPALARLAIGAQVEFSICERFNRPVAIDVTPLRGAP